MTFIRNKQADGVICGFIRNKQADGVICGKFYRKYKYCPYHPKNKEKKNVYKRA
jgi:hypothetical protein